MLECLLTAVSMNVGLRQACFTDVATDHSVYVTILSGCNFVDKNLSYRRDSVGRRSLRRSRSFKVTDLFWYQSIARMRFLSVNDSSLHRYLHRLPDIAQY